MTELGKPEVVGLAALAMALVHVLSRVIDKLLAKKENGNAGQKATEFWLIEYRKMEDTIVWRIEKILEDEVERRLDEIKVMILNKRKGSL